MIEWLLFLLVAAIGVGFSCCCNGEPCWASCPADIRTKTASIPLAFTGTFPDTSPPYNPAGFNGTYSLDYTGPGAGTSMWEFHDGNDPATTPSIDIILQISNVPAGGYCGIILQIGISAPAGGGLFAEEFYQIEGQTNSPTYFCTSFSSTMPHTPSMTCVHTINLITSACSSALATPLTITFV